MSAEAQMTRKAMLSNLRRIVKLCDCEWPIQIHRNGHGHHPDCPAAQAARFGQRIDPRLSARSGDDG